MAESRSIIIVGVGPFISTSLAHRLAAQNWKIALLSRSQEKLDILAQALKGKHPNASILTDAVDAGDADGLLKALSKAKEGLGAVDVLCYNAARVGADDLMTLKPETLMADFKTAAIGTLLAGQWFAKNANTSRVDQGEYPLLLVTGGVLHQQPFPSYASLSTVKSASQNIATNLSYVLPKQFKVQVGQPLIVQPIIPKESGGYQTTSVPEVIVDEVFMPYFEDRMNVRDDYWKPERVF